MNPNNTARFARPSPFGCPPKYWVTECSAPNPAAPLTHFRLDAPARPYSGSKNSESHHFQALWPQTRKSSSQSKWATHHDLRRIFRSLAAAEGVPSHVAERCLNHKLKVVEGIYDRSDYFEERRKAHQQVAARLEALIHFN